jgi:hypothetical protein
MKVLTSPFAAIKAVVSKTILRNLVFLTAMGIMLLTNVFAPAWASEILIGFPCFNLHFTPPAEM